MQISLLVGLIVGLICIWPTYQYGFICCISPVVFSVFIGGSAGFLASRQSKAESLNRGAETGAISSLIAGVIALAGFFFEQIYNSLLMDFGFPRTGSRPGLIELSKFAIENDCLLFIQRTLVNSIMSIFLLAIVVAVGAIAGHYQSRQNLDSNQGKPIV